MKKRDGDRKMMLFNVIMGNSALHISLRMYESGSHAAADSV